MAARPVTLVSEEEYLGSQYEPDCELDHGVLIERNLGTERHSWLQAALAAYFFRRRKAWGLNVYTEQRIRVKPGKYKLPDVCVVEGERPVTPVLEKAPLLVVEILSPEDKPLRVDRTISEWLEFGVEHVWVIDPETLESTVHTSAGRVFIEDATLTIPGTSIVVPLRDLDED
jgi:Uma2 family endonuclease